jgi:hypothetical protein
MSKTRIIKKYKTSRAMQMINPNGNKKISGIFENIIDVSFRIAIAMLIRLLIAMVNINKRTVNIRKIIKSVKR